MDYALKPMARNILPIQLFVIMSACFLGLVVLAMPLFASNVKNTVIQDIKTSTGISIQYSSTGEVAIEDIEVETLAASVTPEIAEALEATSSVKNPTEEHSFIVENAEAAINRISTEFSQNAFAPSNTDDESTNIAQDISVMRGTNNLIIKTGLNATAEVRGDAEDEAKAAELLVASIEEAETAKSEAPESDEVYYNFFTKYMDLGSWDKANITAETLNQWTDYYASYQSLDNQFIGKGDVFIKAAEESGLSPLFIYGLAAIESGWGTSDLAINNSNYFGIGAWDDDMSKAGTFGNSFDDGIIGGAKWIAEHYYQNGQTTVYSMNNTYGNNYAPGNDVWIPYLVEFIQSYYYIV